MSPDLQDVTSTAATREPEERSDDPRLLIELGLVLSSPLDRVDREAVERLRDTLLSELEPAFPSLRWSLPLVERESPATGHRASVVELLQAGAEERELRHWDFALVVTGADLVGRSRPWTLAVPSRSLDVAVTSTFRIDPTAAGERPDEAERVEVLVRRLRAIALHLLGDLADLSHAEDDEADPMSEPSEVEDLDRRGGFGKHQLEQLREELHAVGDARLEERRSMRGRSLLAFQLQASWICRAAILEAVRKARPWEFPLRLGRLSAAAFSALLIMIITAEVWDLGMSLRPSSLIPFTVTALLATSAFVLKRQGLLLGRRASRPTEQRAITNASIVVIVAVGMAATWLLLFGVTLAATSVLFPDEVVRSWATSLETSPRVPHYLLLAGLVASFGLVVGALGASFEGQDYFRHVAFADEEL